ncbi:MAG: RNA polymerase sigma factor [Phycisphaerales bacterium]|nr:RNA polymerase sigma factor [Planctomycetota bacterium]MCH8509676.1 RNA polymerase sigma factor [Phycisphaerales bacterium]
MVERSDEQLLRAFAAGEDAALAELAARHEAGMLGVARGLLGGNDALAREVVQEAWVRVIRGAGRFRADAAARTWLYRIVVTRCADARGREARAHRPRAGENGRDGIPPADRVRLAEALAGLSPEHRETVVLCYARGMTQADAAAVLGIPLGTVKSRLHTAMGRLRTALDEEDGGRS